MAFCFPFRPASGRNPSRFPFPTALCSVFSCRRSLALVAFLAWSVSPSHALASTNVGAGSSSIPCNSYYEASVAYNYATKTVEFCNGTVWGNLLAAGTTDDGIDLGTSAIATNPSVANDLTTGLFSAATSTVSIATGGVEALRVNSAGYVGIGTSIPTFKLALDTSITSVASFSSSGYTNAVDDNVLQLSTSGNEARAIVGNVGNSHAGRLIVGNGGTDILGDGTNLDIDMAASGYIAFRKNPFNTQTELMRITNGGNVGIGTTTPTAGVEDAINGALSSSTGPAMKLSGTWVTGGTATTNKPQLLIEPAGTISTGWSTIGTGIGVNAASPYTGTFLDLQVAGTDNISLSAPSTLTFYNHQGTIAEGTSGYQLAITSRMFTTGGYGLLINDTSSVNRAVITAAADSGAVNIMNSSNGFNPASSTATYTGLQISETITQSGTATGVTRGLWINPTLAAAYDFRGIETAAYTENLLGTPPATRRTVYLNQATYAAAGAETITTASTLDIVGAPIAGSNVTITHAYALNVEAGGVYMGGIANSATGDYVCWNGGVLGYNTATCTLSDENAKQDIAPLTGALDEVLKFQPVHFRYKNGLGYDSEVVHVGFTAQRMATVDPRVVEFKDSAPHAVAYESVSAINSAAIQDVQKEIDNLREENTALRRDFDVYTTAHP